MAATDKPYRDQNMLDVVFAVSSILMLVSIVWMFVQDYNREFKTEQRAFRDVEAALAQRMALDQMPGEQEFKDAEQTVERARKRRDAGELRKEISETARDLIASGNVPGTARLFLPLALAAQTSDLSARLDLVKAIPQIRSDLAAKLPEKERNDMAYNEVNADLGSITSFYNIEVEKHGTDSAKAEDYRRRIDELAKKLQEAQDKKDKIYAEIKDLQAQVERYEGPLTKAVTDLKKVTDRFDTQVRLAISKQWGVGDLVRTLWVIEGFASPLKIHQFTINDIPIDYNFKYVTRFDRCMSCHQGIDRPAFSKDKLRELIRVSSEYERDKISVAHQIMFKRRQDLKGLPERAQLPKWQELKLSAVSKSQLTEARINEYCAHPRLDLFVGANSKHPAERFGCTSCHSGQGSSTSFTLASHTPNNATAKERWTKEHGWEAIHMWDFPMLPQRFVESSCLKCHHQVTDLVSSENRNEAPKLLRGYNLIKENGCFGCHEIHGRKGGRPVGPDLRLEPTPPLEELTPLERTKAESDPDNPPGNLRKVGPSLYRLSEKTHPDWVARWLRSPRSFRPDTKMPHFYGLSNNDAAALKGTGQEKFPDTEIWAATHYLFEASKKYLQGPQRLEELKAKDAGQLSEDERKEMAELARVLAQLPAPKLAELAGGYQGDADKGRVLFSERGCLACHSHEATGKTQGEAGKPTFAPSIASEAQFAPNLSQVREKLLDKKNAKGKEAARKWLVQWLLNPQFHSPRSRMPVTHLTSEQSADVAEWLLAQQPTDLGPAWEALSVAEPEHSDLQKLAEVYLVRILSRSDMAMLLKEKADRTKEETERLQDVAKDIPVDEKALLRGSSTENLKHYLGRKAVGRLGCYACHDIPGFDSAKPIGVGLIDWGKKMPDRLGFEDISNFLEEHYYVVPGLVDENGRPFPPKVERGKKKMPYEKFYADGMDHHHRNRESYLNQKVLDPRSYDHNRIRPWDDRARMPQFQLARARQKPGESAADFESRQWKEEAEAREAVATFVLGLVAEPVPMANVNQPKGDRLAEVKGRQILDKYNCAGCHLLRPGYMEFKATPEITAKLDELSNTVKNNAQNNGEHFFLDHANWVGKNPTSPDRLSAHAVKARLYLDEDDGKFKAEFKLTRALRFQGADKTLKDIAATNTLRLDPKLMIAPPREVWQDKDAMAAYLKDQGPFGGTFADLLVGYLMKKDKEIYKPSGGEAGGKPGEGADSDVARASVPPILLGQGERTQAEWLYQFLLNPQKVRQMTVLQMPKFNMSKDEARALVDYFAAVERNENPGIGLTSPYETIAQQEDIQEGYWLNKNAEYVASLKAKDRYNQRVDELKPIWAKVRKELEAKLAEATAMLEKAKASNEEAKQALKKEEDKKAKETLEKVQAAAEDIQKGWAAEVKSLTEALYPADSSGKKQSFEENQKELWETREAYLTDAFRLVNDKDLCSKCHQVGKTRVENQTQGPLLTLAHKRLRPGWTARWIATPQKFLTYGSSMPLYFKSFETGKEAKNQELFAAEPLDQVLAIRDLLMNYPRAQALPVNQYRVLPPPKDSGEKKK